MKKDLKKITTEEMVLIENILNTEKDIRIALYKIYLLGKKQGK